MRHEVKLPKLGDTTQVVVVNEWLVEPGAAVQAGQALMSVETDKVTADVPSPVAGTLVEQLVRPQDEVDVGAVICVIDG
ncbi:MAG TPA: biotin/lipoyl-containing protein [Acidimicrobiales bacterium]|nr:biotin/lipoyl-containing protein [Acidimicrobiales bacterium]